MIAPARNVLIVTLGSGGDVYPFLAIGRELAARGCKVHVLTNPVFERAVRSAQLGFLPLGTAEQYEAAIAHPDLVHPLRGGMHVLRHLLIDPAREIYVATRHAARSLGACVIVRHHICLAAGWAAERERLPDIPCTLAPLCWTNPRGHSVYGALPFALPLPLAAIRQRISILLGRMVLDRPLNILRQSLGLASVTDHFLAGFRGWPGGLTPITLGLWSPQLRGPLPGDPPNSRIVGPCVYDTAGATIATGKPSKEPTSQRAPVCFTLGTSVAHHAGDFYTTAAEVLTHLGRPGIFVTGPGDSRRAQTAANRAHARSGLEIEVCGYVPYSQLFGRCAAVVHHGGVGTTHAALAAGVPQVVMAFANDEFDNAARVQRAGVGVGMRANSLLFGTPLSAGALAGALVRVLQPQLATRAAQFGAHERARNGAAAAADPILDAIGTLQGDMAAASA